MLFRGTKILAKFFDQKIVRRATVDQREKRDFRDCHELVENPLKGWVNNRNAKMECFDVKSYTL